MSVREETHQELSIAEAHPFSEILTYLLAYTGLNFTISRMDGFILIQTVSGDGYAAQVKVPRERWAVADTEYYKKADDIIRDISEQLGLSVKAAVREVELFREGTYGKAVDARP